MYKVIPGHHEVGAIGLCDESGIKVICRTCKTEDFWPTPADFFDRPGFFDILDDLINVHSAKELFWGYEEVSDQAPEMIKIPLWQRAKWAVQILKDKYVALDED